MAKILIAFKSGQKLEVGEVILGPGDLAVHGHFSEMLKAVKAKSAYKAKNLWIEADAIDFILYEEKE